MYNFYNKSKTQYSIEREIRTQNSKYDRKQETQNNTKNSQF